MFRVYVVGYWIENTEFIVRNLSSANDLDGRVISKLPFERESFLEKRNKGDHLIPHQLYRTDRRPVRACQISTASRSAIFGRTSMTYIHFALTSASFRSVEPQSQIVAEVFDAKTSVPKINSIPPPDLFVLSGLSECFSAGGVYKELT